MREVNFRLSAAGIPISCITRVRQKKKARGIVLPRAFRLVSLPAYFINIIFLLFVNFCPDAPFAVIR